MICRAQRPSVVLAILGAAFFLLLAGRAEAATFTVNTTADTPLSGAMCTGSEPCSLRAAVQSADAAGGASTITVPAGTYTIAVPSTGADDPSNGDLDIDGASSVTIQGSGSGSTILDAAGIDRAFAVQAASSLSISGMTIEGGKPAPSSSQSQAGGAIFSEGELIAGPDLVMTGNEASTGGAVYVGAPAPKASFTEVTVDGNRASGGVGGGIAVAAAGVDVSLTSSALSENDAGSGEGGNLFVGEGNKLTSTDTDYTQGTAAGGGGVYIAYGTAAPVEFSGGTISDNQATARGGGLYTQSAIEVTHVAFDNNSAQERGGGLTVEAQVPLRLTDSTFLGNTSANSGALDVSSYEPDSVIVNSTFSGNGATESGSVFGGYYFVGKFDLINSTVVDNVGPAAAIGKLEIAEPHEVGVVNSIITGNEGGNCELPLANDGGHNIMGADCEPATPVAGDQIGVDPLVEPPAENGGGIMTMALQGKSPAIDAGDSAVCPAADERGVSRTGGCDIGAFEYFVPAPEPPKPGPEPTPSPTPVADQGTPAKGEGAPASAPSVPPTSSAKYKFGIKKILHPSSGGTAKLRVRYNGPGLIQLTGKRVESVSRRTEAGIAYLPVVPNEALAQTLAERGRAHVVVMVQFTPDAGVGRIKEKPVGVWLYR